MKPTASMIALVLVAAATGPVGIAAGPAAAAPQKKPINFCDGGVDSKTCVSCLDKECHIGNAQGDGRTGLMTVDFPAGTTPAKQVRVEFGEANPLATIEGDADGYVAITLPLLARGSAPDGAQSCNILVYNLGRFIPPPAAPEALDALTPKDVAAAVVERRTTLHLGPYTARDTIGKGGKDGRFTLTRQAIYQFISVEKSCGFNVRPTFENRDWNNIRITIPPLQVTL